MTHSRHKLTASLFDELSSANPLDKTVEANQRKETHPAAPGKRRRHATKRPAKPASEMPSGYQAMWLFAMFDLPVDTKSARRQYAQFRKALIKEGFSMLQYSVYARYCPSEETADVYKQRIHPLMPPNGQVRLLGVTERQFGKMEVYFGKKRKPVEDKPPQMMLF